MKITYTIHNLKKMFILPCNGTGRLKELAYTVRYYKAQVCTALVVQERKKKIT